MTKPNAYLAAKVREQKILLYMIDDGASCVAELTGVAFVLQTVLTAAQSQKMRQSQMLTRIKVALNTCLEMAVEDSYVKDNAPVLCAALDDSLKIARLLSPASIMKAAQQ